MDSYLDTMISFNINYLNSLENLGDEWICGNSKAPEQDVIEQGKRLLKCLRFNKNLIIKILVGPIPNGGISFELKTEEKTLLLNIYNNGNYELETCILGLYEEININRGNFINTILTQLLN